MSTPLPQCNSRHSPGTVETKKALDDLNPAIKLIYACNCATRYHNNPSSTALSLITGEQWPGRAYFKPNPKWKTTASSKTTQKGSSTPYSTKSLIHLHENKRINTKVHQARHFKSKSDTIPKDAKWSKTGLTSQVDLSKFLTSGHVLKESL